MGIVNIFLKNIPEEFHLDSFEVNVDISNLKKQRPTNPMRFLSFQEYMGIQEENDTKVKSGNPNQICIYRGDKWRGYFESTRNITLERIGLQAERQIHVRGRYDLINRESGEELERNLLEKLKNGELEGTTRSYKTGNYPITTSENPTGLIKIGMWPCLTCDMQYLTRDIIVSLLNDGRINREYNSEISIIYSKLPFGQNANLTIEALENEHKCITYRDQPKPFSLNLINDETDSIKKFMAQFEREIPSKPKRDPTFFSAMFATQDGRVYY